MEIVDSQKSVGGPCESVLLCGRWFGTGNKCGHSQTFRLIKGDCYCTRCILNGREIKALLSGYGDEMNSS